MSAGIADIQNTWMSHAGRGLQPRPGRFDATAIFVTCEKPSGRDNMPRPSFFSSYGLQFKAGRFYR